MLTATQTIQLSVAAIPIVGLIVLGIDQLSSQKSITMRTVVKVMGLSLLPSIIILGMQGLLSSPMVTGFVGLTFGFVLARLVYRND